MTIMSNNIVESKGLSEAFGVCGMELVHGLLDDGAGRGGIEAHEAFAGAAEHGAVVQGEACAVGKERQELVVRERRAVAVREGAAVQEHQERCLGTHHRDARHGVVQRLPQVVDVVLDVAQTVVQPLCAVAVGGDDGLEREQMAVAQLVVAEVGMEALAQRVVGYDGVAAGEAGDVEGLRGAGEGDAVLRSDFADGGEGDVVVAGEGEVGMDLIADYDDALALTDVGHAGEFVARPDAPSGVVGMAEEEEFAAFGLALEVGPIDFHQGGGEPPPAPSQGGGVGWGDATNSMAIFIEFSNG